MKHIFVLLFSLFALLVEAQAQQQFDPQTADTVQYFSDGSGKYIVIVSSRIAVDTLLDFGNGNIQVGKIYKDVDGGTVINVKQNRLTARLNALSQIEQQFVAYKEQLLKDSLSIAADKAAFEAGGGSTSELFAAKLKELAGVWTLKVNASTDQITVAESGDFTSKKSGAGKIALEATDKMLVTLGANKLRLYEKAGAWYSQDGKIQLTR